MENPMEFGACCPKKTNTFGKIENLTELFKEFFLVFNEIYL